MGGHKTKENMPKPIKRQSQMPPYQTSTHSTLTTFSMPLHAILRFCFVAHHPSAHFLQGVSIFR